MVDNKESIDAIFLATDLRVPDLTAKAWDKAPSAVIDHYWSGEPAPSGCHAEARILWSTEALYVRFVGNQADPLVISRTPRTTEKTMQLWDRDVCEIFIATDPNFVERYFEFEVAPTGEWLDVAIDWTTGQRQSDWSFESQMTTAAKIEEDAVTMAMRIPWNDRLYQPDRGERWRINLLRCMGSDPNRIYLSWQATRTSEPNFHVPQVFGSLVFT
jgi:hypothetical protein